jgi:hypothetical protein
LGFGVGGWRLYGYLVGVHAVGHPQAMSQKQVARREISECVGLIVLALIAPGIGVGMSGLVGTVDIWLQHIPLASIVLGVLCVISAAFIFGAVILTQPRSKKHWAVFGVLLFLGMLGLVSGGKGITNQHSEVLTGEPQHRSEISSLSTGLFENERPRKWPASDPEEEPAPMQHELREAMRIMPFIALVPLTLILLSNMLASDSRSARSTSTHREK